MGDERGASRLKQAAAAGASAAAKAAAEIPLRPRKSC